MGLKLWGSLASKLAAYPIVLLGGIIFYALMRNLLFYVPWRNLLT